MDTTSLAGRRLWIGIPGPELDDETRRLLDEIRPGGSHPLPPQHRVDGAGQRGSTAELAGSGSGDGLHVAVDQEGGLVVRFDRELTVFPGNMALGAAAVREPSLGEHLAEAQGRIAAFELRELGITVNLAPCCDLATRGDNPGLGTRAFAAWPRLAGRLAAAMVRGHSELEVVSTLKHFPGLGNASLDSHLDLPVAIAGNLDDLLEPFLAGILAGAQLVMTTHVQFRDLDDAPATFSRRIVGDLLRGRLQHRGCVMTDDLEMGAMTARFGFDDVVRSASAAGHDILAICHDAGAPAARVRAPARRAWRRASAWAGDAGGDRGAPRRRFAEPAPSRRRPIETGAEVADAIAGRAVTVVRDDRKLLPLRRGESVLVVTVASRAETQVEDPLRGEPLDRAPRGVPARRRCSARSTRTRSRRARAAIVAEARRFRRVLVLTTLARFRADEARLVRELLAARGLRRRRAPEPVRLRGRSGGRARRRS